MRVSPLLSTHPWGGQGRGFTSQVKPFKRSLPTPKFAKGQAGRQLMLTLAGKEGPSHLCYRSMWLLCQQSVLFPYARVFKGLWFSPRVQDMWCRELRVLTFITWGTHRPQPQGSRGTQGSMLTHGSLGNPVTAGFVRSCLHIASHPWEGRDLAYTVACAAGNAT